MNPTSYSELIGYANLDVFKRLAIKSARATAFNNPNLDEEPLSRGESCYVAWMKYSNHGVGMVIEGLGTKSIVAEDVYKMTGDPYGFSVVSEDTIAMIVNDMITVGAMPAIIEMHIAVGDSKWLTDEVRVQALIDGWRKGCDLSGAIWGGGETPTLKIIVHEEYPEISGSAVGFLKRNEFLNGRRIAEGDTIILFESSGIHANGITAAREVADMLPNGYTYLIKDEGLTYGKALLVPTTNYVPLMRQLIHDETIIHYAVNITGHGWRKLMRATEKFEYIIGHIPKPQEVFGVIQEKKLYSLSQMYADFNMGAGFALYVPKESVNHVLDVSVRLGYKAIDAGNIQKSDRKSIRILPLQIEFDESTLDIR